MNAAFCVVCGRTDRPLSEGICPDCYAERHPLVSAPPRASVTLCPTCGARLRGNHWERRGTPLALDADDLAPMLTVHPEVGVRTVEWVETGRDPLVRELEGQFRLRFRDTERTLAVPLTVLLTHRTCPECSRRSGHYYTARIQLRGPEGRRGSGSKEIRERLGYLFDRVLQEAKPAWQQALSWKEALPEGWDFYATDTVAARSLVRLARDRLGGELRESASLYGRKDGAEVYRVTLRLRVPAERLETVGLPSKSTGDETRSASATRRTARLRREPR